MTSYLKKKDDEMAKIILEEKRARRDVERRVNIDI